MENISTQLGGRIRQYRQQMGLTQEALAYNSGLNVSFLGDVERGIKKPSIETLEKLLKAMNITFQEFFDFEATVETFKEREPLVKLNMELKNRSDYEIEVAYNVIQQILAFGDSKQSQS